MGFFNKFNLDKNWIELGIFENCRKYFCLLLLFLLQWMFNEYEAVILQKLIVK